MKIKKGHESVFPKYKLIETYRKMDSFELSKIKVKWAIRENSKYMRGDFEDYSFFIVNLYELIAKVNFGEMDFCRMDPNKLFTESINSNYRIARCLDHWRNSKYIDPPRISLDSLDSVSISDGRHRTITAFQLGEKEIPVAIPNCLIDLINSKIDLKNLKL